MGRASRSGSAATSLMTVWPDTGPPSMGASQAGSTHGYMCAGARGREQPQLLLSKALGLLNGIQQLLFQLFIALVRWEIQTVETVGRGEQYRQHGKVRAPTAWPQPGRGDQKSSHDCGSITMPTSWQDANTWSSRTLLCQALMLQVLGPQRGEGREEAAGETRTG